MEFQKPDIDFSSIQKLFRWKGKSRREKMDTLGIILAPVLLLVAISTFSSSSDRPQPKHPSNYQELYGQEQARQNPGKDGSAVKDEKASSLPMASSMLFQNPFVEERAMAQFANAPQNASANPSFPRTASTANLPAIPQGSYAPASAPRPNVPAISLPAIPSAGSVPAPSAAPSAPARPSGSVAGVLTGDDGSSMAIMSDGTVVSAGDTYHGDRIAYIGGDGIQFDDGHTLDYK